MSDSDPQPFAGLFDLPAPGHGRDFNWQFFEPDLNASARRLLTHLDRLMVAAAEPDCVFLTTIENDVEAGRFPDVLMNFFAGECWSTSARFFVAQMTHAISTPELVVGRLTFETRPQQLTQVLVLNNGFAWGVDLSVGGVQVRNRDVAEALTLNPFAPSDARRLEAIARLAWSASRDLDRLGLNVSSGDRRTLQSIKEMPTG